MRSPPSLLHVLPLGLAVGVMSGLFGVGGGALAVPVLLWMGFAQHAAHATSLAAIVIIATASAVPFAIEGAVHLQTALVLVVGSLVGVSLGAGLMHRIPGNGLRLAFAVFLVLAAVRMLVGVELGHAGHVPDLSGWDLMALLMVGLAAGGLSAVLGVGGGILLVPALALGFDFSQHAAEGTSLVVIVPTALLGALRHTSRGYTQWRTGLWLGAGGVGGGVAGAMLALALDGPLLQRLFAAFLIMMSVHLVLRGREESAA